MDERIRVLHVDDDPGFRDLTKSLLEDSDERLAVELAANADEGLERLEDGDIECVVSDYEMPGMDGIEFLEAVREQYPDLPFILFTGKGSEEIAAEAVAADVSGYLQKGGKDTYELLRNRVCDEVADYRLSSSYREYKTIIDSLTDPVYVTDQEGLFTDVNDAFLELTGYDESAVIGSHPSLVKTEESVTRAEAHLRRILSDDQPDAALFEVEIEAADGETIPCEDHMGVIPFEGEQFRGSVGVLRDISDRRESEQFRRDLYEVTATSDLGFEEQCRQMLQLGCERLDVEQGKLVRTDADAGTHETVVTAYDTGEEGQIADLSQTYCRQVIETGGPLAIHDAASTDWRDDPAFEEYGHACYTGTEVRVDGDQFGTVCFFGPDPQPDSFTDAEMTFVELIGRTVGHLVERRRSRDDFERRKRVLGRIHDIIADHESTHDERIGALLDLGRETLGTDYATVSRIQGDRYHAEVLRAEDESVSEGDVFPLSKTACERTISQSETQNIARFSDHDQYESHPVHTELGFECYIGTPLYVDSEVYGTVCFLDTEERTRPFSEWERTLVELLSQWISYEFNERANRQALARERDRLEEFASVVSHDLRNPIQFAQTNLELVQEDVEHERVGSAVDALDRAEQLIDQLLTLARNGETVSELETVALDDLTETCWGLIATSDASLSVETEQAIRADPSRLKQLFENLFRNSVEHGGDDVTVTVGDCPGGFYVADDGPGIPPAEREDVFDAGYSTRERGSGFGLAIVEQIAVAHDWEVSVSAADGGGARFEVTGVDTLDA